jgi:hypothetical protein
MLFTTEEQLHRNKDSTWSNSQNLSRTFLTRNIYDKRMFTARKGFINLSVPEAQVRDSLFVLLCSSLEDHRRSRCRFESKE